MAFMRSLKAYKKADFLWKALFVGIPLLAFVGLSVFTNSRGLWFANPDQDLTLIIESLRQNDGLEPVYVDHPAVGIWPWFSKLFILYKFLGFTEVSRFSEFLHHADPLVLLPSLFEMGRISSLILALGFASAASLLVKALTRNTWLSIGIWGLSLSSFGLFLHSMILRTELSAMTFFLLSLLLWLWAQDFEENKSYRKALLLSALAGVAFAYSVYSKLVVLPFFLFFVIFHGSRDRMERPRNIWRWGLLNFVVSVILLFAFSSRVTGDTPFVFGLSTQMYVVAFFAFLTLLWARFNLPHFLLCMRFSSFFSGLFGGVFIVFYFGKMRLGAQWVMDFVGNPFAISGGSHLTSAYSSGTWADVVGHFSRFLSDHLFAFGHLSLFLICLLFLKRKPSIKIIIFFGAAMCIDAVNSLRYYWEPYLLFSQSFYLIGVALILQESKVWDGLSLRIKRIYLAFAWCLMFLFMVWATPFKYFHFNGFAKNKLEALWSGMITAAEYQEHMQVSYPKFDDFVERVLCDPELNGGKSREDFIPLINVGELLLDVESRKGRKICL